MLADVRADRLVAILLLLQARGQVTAGEVAEEHGTVYTRIDAIDEGRDKTLRSLDLKDPAVRAAILAAEKDGKSAADLFNGPQSRSY